MPEFRLEKGSLQDRFLQSRSKIQMFGGGFGNGKTSAACIKALQFAQLYPGSNGLMARSTYPKLNDTLRKEFLKWCPPQWIKSFPMSANATNTCTLTNGTMINFRYLRQQGKNSQEATTSNLLSATFDWAVVDQIEDPEITHKDFLDILGRMRGSAPYVGDDPTMPQSGPRWIIITANPTRNWVYKKLVLPLHKFLKTGQITEDLMVDEDGRPILELFEGSTYTNKANLPEDFIETLEATYRGQMRARFLMGEWAAYEGLVYWMWDEAQHTVPKQAAYEYYMNLAREGYRAKIVEGYDYGLANPSCYLFGFVAPNATLIVCDGFYQPELELSEQFKLIHAIRRRWLGSSAGNSLSIMADPAIFRRTIGNKNIVGQSIADMFRTEGFNCVAGNNDVINGITKVQGYLLPQKFCHNPLTGTFPSPHLLVSEEMDWFIDEINGYYWDKDTNNEPLDKPVKRNDHAMDALKYMLSRRAEVSVQKYPVSSVPAYLKGWAESEIDTGRGRRRYYG